MIGLRDAVVTYMQAHDVPDAYNESEHRRIVVQQVS